MLFKGVAFLYNLCSFDTSYLKKTIDDEIANVEVQIAEAKASSKECRSEKLA
jgi:hypothetical protein